MDLFIDDGYTLAKSVSEKRGVCPAAIIVFRHAPPKKRHEYSKALGVNDPAKTDAWESELIESHVKNINGEPIPKGRSCRLNNEIHKICIDLILGYEPADEPTDEGDLKN